MEVLFGKDNKKKYDTALVLINDGNKFGQKGQMLDTSLDGLLSHAVKNTDGFNGGYGQSILITLGKGTPFNRVIVIGAGDKKYDANKQSLLGKKANIALNAAKAKEVLYLLDEENGNDKEFEFLFLEGVVRRNYRYTALVTKEDHNTKTYLQSVTVDADHAKSLNKDFDDVRALLEGVKFASDLTQMPANYLYPESYADIITQELKPLGVKVKVLDDKKLEKMGAGAIMAVGKGSARKPRIVILEYNGLGKDSNEPIALVGKGVTFDTGGYSLKPPLHMEEMVMDMGGSAIVAGTLMALAKKKAKVHVVAALALAENMISEIATRPGDVVKSLSGQTIEILNTDAEGRLVMCDAITYLQNEYSPKYLMDFATLTGATIITFEYEYASLFANDDSLSESALSAAKAAGEKLWPMPLDEAFAKRFKSNVADFTNHTNSRNASTCCAAQFLKKFVNDNVSWAHFDVANVVFNMESDNDISAKGSTGYGPATVMRLIENLSGK